MSVNRSVDHDDFQLDLPSIAGDSLSEGVSLPTVTGRASVGPTDVGRRKGYRVNYWLLAGTVLLVAVGAPSLQFLRNYQVQRNAQVLIGRAEAKEAEEDWRGAADFYHRYLQLAPNDDEMIIARARAFDKSADSPDRANRAIALLFQAVDTNPDDTDLRLRLAERHFEQERWIVAQEQALQVLEREPGRLEAARISALALRAQAGPSRVVPLSNVIDAHRTGLQNHPGDPVLSISLARLYRDNLNSLPDHTPEQVAVLADRVMDRMVAERPEDGEAWLARHRYRRTYDLSGAEADLEKSLELAPEKADVLVAAASQFLDIDPQRSLNLAERLRAIEPEEARSYQLLSEIQSRTGHIDEAIATLSQAIAEFGKDNYLLQRTLLTVALDHRRLELAHETWEEIGRWLERFSPYMPAKNRRRFNEDHQFTRARMLLLEGQADAAILFLKPLTAVMTEGGDADENLRQREQRWSMLAEAYGQLQQWDLAADAMAEAARLRPTGYQSLLAEAGMVRRAGDLDRAIRLFQDAASKPEAPASTWLIVAEALIEQEFQRVAGQARDWRRVRSVLDRVRPELEGTPAFVSLLARWALADGRTEDALKELIEILPVESVPINSAAEVALLFAAAGDPDTADALVKRLLEDPRRTRQGEAAQVELLVRRRDYEGAHGRLVELEATGREAELRELLPQLLVLRLEGGHVQDVRQRLARFRDEGPTTVPLLELGALVAFKAQDWTEHSRYVKALGRVEGQNGTIWRFHEALASLETRGDANGVDLARARELLGELQKLRPQWPSNLVVKGRLAEKQGRIEEATEHYQEAVLQGTQSLLVMDWLVAGLYRQSRFAEASDFLRRIGPMVGISSQLSGLTLPAYIREGRYGDAVRIAKLTAELHPEEAMPQVLYGQALALTGDTERAEELFRRAVELSPKDVRTWGGLVWFYARGGDLDRVRSVLSEVDANQGLDKLARDLLYARGLASIGNRIGAELRYQAVLDLRPEDPVILDEVARFHLQGDLERSLELFRKLLSISPKSVVARRSIALIMGMRGSEEGLEEALQLFRERDQETSSPMDERLEIMLLLRGNEQQRAEALLRMSRLVMGQQEVPPSDRVLMARALELSDRPDEAQEQFEILLRSEATADFIAIYLAFLQRQEKYELADTWLKRLEEKDPGGFNYRALRSDWLATMGRESEIIPLMEQYVEGYAEQGGAEFIVAVRQAVAVLLRNSLHEPAERLLREVARREVEGGEFLVAYLIEQERMGEAADAAIDHAIKFADQKAPILLTQVMTLLAAKKIPDSSLRERSEEQLARAVETHSGNERFLFDLGTLRVMQGRNDDAIALYEAALQLRPDYLLAMNNLAIILAGKPDRQAEAVATIERLVSLVPESAEVRDSQALVYISCNRFEEALEVLEPLISDSPEKARYHFHAAVARDRLGDVQGAREAFHQGWSHGLEAELLTPAEHEFIEHLTREYGKPDKP